MLTFEEYVTEAGLGGKSRSGGKANWDYYVIDTDAWKTQSFEIDKDADMVSASGDKIVQLKKDQAIKILSPETKKIGPSIYAQIEAGKQIGFIKIDSIRKPGKSKNTKTFTPSSLNLAGKTFNLDTLTNAIIASIKTQQINDEIKEYMLDTVSSIVNKNLFEAMDRFTKDIKLSREYDLDPKSELNVISKNFGEVLCALFLLKTNKKIQSIEFPIEENYPLCDFIAIDKGGIKTFFSVKSGGGSSTDINNIKIFLPYLKLNTSSEEYKVLDIILAQIKISKNGQEAKEKNSTTNAILRYWNLPQNITIWNEFVAFMNKGESAPIIANQLTVDSINGLWKKVIEVSNRFDKLLEGLTKYFNYEINAQTRKTLEQIFDSKQKTDISKGGFLLYPMGSSLIKQLNDNPKMVDLLNQIITLSPTSGMVSQMTIDAYKDKLVIKIIKFKNNRFKFSFNSMMKAVNNRPLGFKEA